MTKEFHASPGVARFVAALALLIVGVASVCAQDANQSADGAAGAADKQLDSATKPDGKEQVAEAEAAPAAGELNDGRLIRVRLPLTGNADAHIKSAIQRALAQLAQLPRHEGRRPILILELVPARRHAGFGQGTDYTRAVSLANFLTSPELSPVKTVAYVPQTIKGHGLLVALACDEIVMSPDEELGEAGVDEDSTRPIDPGVVSFYQSVVKKRRPGCEGIALGMLDRGVEVLKVESDDGVDYVVRGDLDAYKQHHTIISQEVVKPAGSLGLYTGREARDYGLVKLLARDRGTMARGLGLPPAAVVEDQSLVGDWRPVMLTVEGPITSRTVHQIETLISTERRQRKTNWIGLKIDSTGGELEDCLRLADTLAGLDVNEVQTVAYVPVEASGGAALVALACDQLVMQPEAHLGGNGTVELDRQTLDEAAVSIRDSLGKNSDRGWSLLAAMIDRNIEVFAYHNMKTGDIRYMSEEEANEQPNVGDWQKDQRIKQAGEVLRLTSDRAKELDVATQVVDSFDEFKQLYGFENDPPVAEPNWALELVEALASPALAVFLLVVGFIGIYIELHAPGIGAGAFVSTLAFMLFFWSQFLHGTAGWLEVLLFLGGMFFLLLEVTVLPGFGIFGLGGGAMILASLVLATQTFVLPTKESQLVELRHSLTIVAAAALCVLAGAMALRRYLPRSPFFSKLLLNPTPEDELDDLDYREAVADFSHLVGEQGTATTNLRPSGKAEFDGELVDVISDGMPIDRGQAVVVISARANRVMVRAVEGV